MSDLDTLLGDTTPEQRANDPILRKAFTVGLLASDIYAPTMESEEAAAQGGLSLMAADVGGTPHVILFSSEKRLHDFMLAGTRYAKIPGNDVFPMLIGQNAILNPGPSGLRLAAEDIAEICGGVISKTDHVHGPDCNH